VFTPLNDGPLTAAQLADTLSVNAEKLSRLLYALVTANLLTVEGDRFANTPEAQQFLVKGQSTYLGGRHEHFSEVWENLLHTVESIRTDVPQGLSKINLAILCYTPAILMLEVGRWN
jgi:DNA-binding IclR family transcriptional regulator